MLKVTRAIRVQDGEMWKGLKRMWVKWRSVCQLLEPTEPELSRAMAKSILTHSKNGIMAIIY